MQEEIAKPEEFLKRQKKIGSLRRNTGENRSNRNSQRPCQERL